MPYCATDIATRSRTEASLGKLTLRLALAAVVVMSLGACAQRQAPLYLWDAFPRQQYAALQGANVNLLEQVTKLEAQAAKARTSNAALPPGFRAHLGMLKLSLGDPEQARQLWLAEKLAFPESAIFMDRLLQRLDRPARSENPA
jgi:hypothetical protein